MEKAIFQKMAKVIFFLIVETISIIFSNKEENVVD